MTFDRAKVLAEGGTYHGRKNMLVECAPLVVSKVEWEPVANAGAAPDYIKEDANLPKRMVIEGVFQRFMPKGADPIKYRNANKRVYTMERVGHKVIDPNGDVQRRINERAMIGHLEHPESGTTDLKLGAILVTKVWVEEDGTVKGRAIVYNNANGKILQEYIETGTRVGISSRGTGTVDAQGFVCEDFQLETWDMVYNPSTFGAHPALKTESVDGLSVQGKVVETATTPATIPSQVKPMSISKRVIEARDSVAQLLAIDPKKLTAEARVKLASDLLDARVRIAEDFVGEQRVPEVVKILESLDAAKLVVEGEADGYRDAPIGNADAGTGIPGVFDPLTKAWQAAGAAKDQTAASFKKMSEMIAANMGKLPAIMTAVENACTAKTEAVTEERHAELKSLLGEARDEIISMTARLEAATAIAESLRKQAQSFKVEAETAKLAEQKQVEAIAALTSNAGKDKTDEAKAKDDEKGDKKPDEKKSEEKVEESVKPKSLTERLAEIGKKAKTSESTLPAKSSVVESTKDASNADTKQTVVEGAAEAPTRDMGAAIFVAQRKRLKEDCGRAH